VMDRVDILSSTLGKAMGGSAGGFITGKKEIVEKLRNQARPYLFSNNVTPSVAVATLKIFDLLDESKDLLQRIQDNTAYFRNEMVDAGFNIRLGKAGEHPICPVMLGDAKLATAIAKDMIEEEGIYVIGFCFPVVPKGEARIRVQISAAHTKEQLDRAIEAFKRVGKKHGVI
jgi:glycine C-acetyltransferase